MKRLPDKVLDFPYGVICGISAIIAFYSTVAFTAVGIVFNAVAGQTNETASPFASWWQTLLFAVALITALAAIAMLVMYIIREVTYKREGKYEKAKTPSDATEAEGGKA